MNSVSVIIPTWNRAHTILNAVRSVLEQTFPPREVLVCDDGSSDATRELVASVADPRIKWIDGYHSGLPAVPLNRGLKASGSEWVAFLGSDDRWLPDKLRCQMGIAENGVCQAVSSNAWRLLPDGRIAGKVVFWPRSRIGFRHLLETNLVVASSMVMRRALLTKVGGFPERECLRVGEDYSLWLRVATLTDIAFIPSGLVVYRDDPMGSVRAHDKDIMLQRRNIFNDFAEWATATDTSTAYIDLARKVMTRSRNRLLSAISLRLLSLRP